MIVDDRRQSSNSKLNAPLPSRPPVSAPRPLLGKTRAARSALLGYFALSVFFLASGLGSYLFEYGSCVGVSRSPAGNIWELIALVGLIPLAAGLLLLLRSLYESVDEQRARLLAQLRSMGPVSVAWLDNALRPELVERDRTARKVLVTGAGLFVVACAGLGLLFSGLWMPTQSTVNSVLGTWFVALVLFLVVGNLPTKRGVYSPLRVGTSRIGVHVEYDPTTTNSRRRGKWAVPFVPWVEVTGIISGVWAGVGFVHKNGAGLWAIQGVSEEIVGVVTTALNEAKGSQDPTSA